MLDNRRRKALGVLLAVVLIFFSFSGCGKTNLKKIAAELSSYTITAEYDDAAHTVKAHQRYEWKNNYDVPLSTMEFHMHGAAYRKGATFTPVSAANEKDAYPNGKSYGSMSVTNVCVDGAPAESAVGGQDKDILIVKIGREIFPGDSVTFEMDFELVLADIMHRLGYNANAVNLGNWYLTASVYEDGAFCSYPYYSNGDPFYSEMANYTVSMTTKPEFVIASTGSMSDETFDNIKKTRTYRAEAVRDFAMILSTKFQVMTAPAGKTQVSYYYYKDAAPEKSLKAGTDSIVTFSKMFGDYPYPTMNVVQTGFLHGGMEYPNLVYISDAYTDDRYFEIIIHETAHQWWYGMVGSNAVTSAWQDEGLTDYSTSLFYDENPEYNQTRVKRIMNSLRNYLVYVDIYSTVGKLIDTSMNRPSNEYKSEFEYTYMTYVKGELMFDTLRQTIGEKAFLNGLKKYFEANKFSNAAPQDMIAAFEKSSRTKLASFFAAWLEGKVTIGG